jgi:predicted MFS family arabinose efflux permease
MAAVGVAGGAAVIFGMRPIVHHLSLPQEHSPWMHFLHTITEPRYLVAFAITGLLTTGGFMLQPFASAYAVSNLGVGLDKLPTVYLITGVFTIFAGPAVGRLADVIGKFRVFLMGTALLVVIVLIYTHLGPTTVFVLSAVNTVLFLSVFARMIPFQALVTTVPIETQRGSFNAVNASLQQLSGGVASVAAGHIVTMGAGGKLQHFDVIGYVVIATSLIAMVLLWQLQRSIAGTPVPLRGAPSGPRLS